MNNKLKVLKYVVKMTCAIIVILPMLLLLIGAFSMGAAQSWGFILFAIVVISIAIFAMVRSTRTFTHKPRTFDMTSIYPIVSSNLILRPEESCWLVEPIQVGHTKEVTAGYADGSAGISVRVAKGVTLHTAARRGVPIKRTITEKFKGTLYITNKRIVCVSSKYGFESPLSSLVHVQEYRNALEFLIGSKSHLLYMKEPLYVNEVLHNVLNGRLEVVYQTRSKIASEMEQ